MPIVVVALLGLGVCSGALAVDVSGFVWFDTAENYPAPCAFVYLYNDTLCDSDSLESSTQAVAGGFYEFTNLDPGNYSVRAQWMGGCVYCNPVGIECDAGPWSECGKFTVIDQDTRVDLHLNIDCQCQ